MTPQDWNPDAPLGTGQIDAVAREIGAAITEELPDTFEEAIALYGPLEITHVQIEEVPPKDQWRGLYFLTSLRGKPDIFFVGFEYICPYFVKYVEYAMVRDGAFRALPRRVEISTERGYFPYLTDYAEIGLAKENLLFSTFTKMCYLYEIAG